MANSVDTEKSDLGPYHFVRNLSVRNFRTFISYNSAHVILLSFLSEFCLFEFLFNHMPTLLGYFEPPLKEREKRGMTVNLLTLSIGLCK